MGIFAFDRPQRLALLALPLAAAAGAAQAAAAPGTGSAKAQINGGITLVRTADLSFGDMIAAPVAGTVIVSPTNDTRTVTGVIPAGGTVQAARFTGRGTPGRIAYVRWSTAPVTLTRIGGGATMVMDQLRTNSVLFVFAGNDPRIIPANGILDIRFGARLRIAANQADGVYEGSFNVTLDYQ